MITGVVLPPTAQHAPLSTHETDSSDPEPGGKESSVQVFPPFSVPIPATADPLALPLDSPVIWQMLVVGQSIELRTRA
jgi:hypothetical protein